MITNRQFQILTYLSSNNMSVHTAKEISEFCNVSIRTIKNDIESIRKLCKNQDCITFQSIPSKGYKLTVIDEEKWLLVLEKIKENLKNERTYNDLNNRIKYMLLDLVENNGVRKNKLLLKYSISESTLYLDLKVAKNIIKKYSLTIMYDNKKGYYINGSEMDKRKFLIGENLYSYVCTEYKNHLSIKEISWLKEKLINIFFKYKYKISENLFESLLIHLMLTFHRISMGYVFQDKNYNERINGIEWEISNEIFKQCININKKELEEEINYLAWNLSGKRELDNECEISEEINEFILKALFQIKTEFGVDFTNSVDLKVALALHFVPLLSRIKNNTQLKNCLLSEIKQTFPFAFDIASYFSILIEKKYHVQINEDEMAYFTLYFNYGLENIPISTSGKKILVISKLRNSETILLRHRINQWFNKQIMILDFVKPVDLFKVDIQQYDVLFTTEDCGEITHGAAVKIGLFPSEQDFYKMNLAINGYNSVESVISRFSNNLFYKGRVQNKQEILDILIDKATKFFNLPPKFKNLVFERERLSSTYFSNKLAMPHTLYPISSQTFVAVALLDEEVEWEENQMSQIVFLISIETNNPKAFQIWPLLSNVVRDEYAIKEMATAKDFDSFIHIFKQYLKRKF